MLTVEEAREQMLAHARQLEPEHVDIRAALGRVLAEPIVSRRVIPPWPNSSMDGYAVRAADTTPAPVVLTVTGRVAAGMLSETPVGAGQAVRIFTGAPLPPGADAVVPQEEVDADGDRIRIRRAVEPGAHVRPRGEDVQLGDRVLEPGRRLGAAEIGLLATLGHSPVLVYRRPRVAVLSNGNELVDLGSEPGPGQIPNTNTYSLAAQVLEAGGEPLNLGVAPDDLGAIEARLGWGRAADVLVTSAGVSVGELDLLREALSRAGATLHLWQVAMRPGKPITFGTLGEQLVFGLPGNPVSAMVTFELFVRPVLLKMSGLERLDRPRVTARAVGSIANPGRRRGYLRVSLGRDAGGYTARLTGDQGSAILRSMVLADGLAVVPGGTVIPDGEPVEVIVLRGLEA
ncbi:MAG TPA: gephyrin-like molybdotransferase Glp [Candidatus Binatia bacterium]|nr:gephyrin-like molybdotransferase Glp [Candidatus Binatia bacterium]